MSDENVELSRWNAILGLGTVGVASAGAGIRTRAYLRDEESFEDTRYTLEDLGAELRTGFLLDGDARTEGTQTYPGSEDGDAQEGPCLRIVWEVPIAVGNEIQTDSVEFDIEFHAQQERHNSEPTTLSGTTGSDDDETTTSLNSPEPVAFPDDYRDDVPYASPTTVVNPSSIARLNNSLIGVSGFDSSAGRAPRRPEVRDRGGWVTDYRHG